MFNIRRKGQSPKLYFMDTLGGRCAFFTAHRDLYRCVLVHFREDGNLTTVGGQNLAPLEAILAKASRQANNSPCNPSS